MIYWLWLCEAAKMLFAQPIDSILTFWRGGFVGYMVHCVPVYLHNLQCSICDEKCDIFKMWIQSDTATFSCQLIVLLEAQPVANIPKFWRDCFVFFCGTLDFRISLWFIVQYSWWKGHSLKKNSVRHSHSYLPFDSVAICTTHWYFFFKSEETVLFIMMVY